LKKNESTKKIKPGRVPKTLLNKCELIKMVITDVDGVLTDGGMYCGEQGEVMKKFNTKDGMGVELLQLKGIKTILMTKENSPISMMRGKKIKAVDTLINIKTKKDELNSICKRFNLDKKNVGYMGDDINDLEIMKIVGVSACPSDAEREIQKVSDYVCEKKGGDGAFREFANLILMASG